MAPLYRTHLGWENEQLAHYLLSRFSFVAHPATVGDDIGSDFYCTIFDVLEADVPKIERKRQRKPSVPRINLVMK